jgi:hypothetical protein
MVVLLFDHAALLTPFSTADLIAIACRHSK